uniref:Uncharacterized protein n=2 Tax=Anopheles gambiae TaxID=7165 RepID=A0A1S4HF02_ANOGA
MHSEDDLIARAHNHHQQQQTTQQITTITKVVREVKQLGPDAGQPFDYVAMPLDMGTDGQPIDYVSMPMGMYTTRTQYLNFNHMDQPEQMVGGAGGGPPVQQSAHLPPGAKVMGGGGPGMPGAMGGGGGGQGHYQDYEHYAQYTDAGYDLGQAAHHPGHAQSYLGEYQMNDRSNTPHTSSENSESSIPMPMGVTQMGGGNPSAAALMAGPGGYLQGQYDEMGEYVIAPGQGGPVDRLYPDNPSAMVYGYVSTPPYGTISSHMDPNGGVEPTYATKQQLAYEAATAQQRAGGGVGGGGVVGNVAPDGSCYYDGEDDLHQQLSNLQIHNHVFLQHIITSPGGNNRPGVSGAGGPSNGAGGGGGGMPDGSGGGMDLDEQRQMKWRDPNLTEVIGFLSHPNNAIKANAAAYLQHLCYMDDPNKQRTRTLGGIPPLVKLLGHENTDVFRNACGALRNLSYGRQNDENKRAINAAGGIQALIHLLRRTAESDIKELVTGIIWNMSSCEDLKRFIIDDAVLVIVSYIIIPHSGWDPTNPGETCWSTVFRNASGILRNVSSAGEYARKKLRECEGLVDSLLYVIRIAIEKSNIGNKIVENCVCILRNLSYRCQEVEDPNYDKNPIPHHGSDGGMSGGSGSHGGGSIVVSAAAASSKGENLGCFGASKKKKEQQAAAAAAQQQAAADKDHSSANGDPSRMAYKNTAHYKAVATGRCTFLSCLTAELFEPGDARGGGRCAAESGRLLLAAEHRDPGDRAQGEGFADPGRAAAHGGGPGGVRGSDGPAQSSYRPKKQGADREVRDARPGAEATVGQSAVRPGHLGRHDSGGAGHAERGDQEECRVRAVAAGCGRRRAADEHVAAKVQVHAARAQVRQPAAVYHVAASGFARRVQEARLEGAGLCDEDDRVAQPEQQQWRGGRQLQRQLAQLAEQHAQPSDGVAERHAVRGPHDEAAAGVLVGEQRWPGHVVTTGRRYHQDGKMNNHASCQRIPIALHW